LNKPERAVNINYIRGGKHGLIYLDDKINPGDLQ
jgi:hypothetical protein